MTENKKTFFDRIRSRLAPSDFTRVRGAYYLAKYGHRAQFRSEVDANNKPLRYFEHCRRVAIILMDEVSCYEPDLIITALLHDAVEDTDAIDPTIIECFFGSVVAKNVQLLSKVPKEGYFDRLLSAPKDVILIKACDRLDNVRSLRHAEPEFVRKQLSETLHYLNDLFSKIETEHESLISKIKETVQNSWSFC